MKKLVIGKTKPQIKKKKNQTVKLKSICNDKMFKSTNENFKQYIQMLSKRGSQKKYGKRNSQH